MRQLSKEGKIAPRVKAEPISVSEEEMMWELGILGDDNPEKLLDTIVYLNGVHFALHAADEHKSLKVNLQFKVGFDNAVGLKYLEYTGCTSKCNQGGLASRYIKPKVSRAYENVLNSDRCMVRLYEKYMSHRPDYLIIIIIIIYLFSFDKVHVGCIDIYQHRLQCHSFYSILTKLHYLFQYPVERGIPVRQSSLSTMVVGYPSVTVGLIIKKQ